MADDPKTPPDPLEPIDPGADDARQEDDESGGHAPTPPKKPGQ